MKAPNSRGVVKPVVDPSFFWKDLAAFPGRGRAASLRQAQRIAPNESQMRGIGL